MQKALYLTLVCIFLSAGLFINFILQKDFLTQLGFSGLVVVITIIFFDGAKVLSEILFFKIKGFSKVIIGIFAIFLFLISVYSTFAVRNWKARQTFEKVEKVNIHNQESNRDLAKKKARLTNQIKSLEGQINTVQKLISSLNGKKDKWLGLRYQKEITKLNNQKIALLTQMNSLDKSKISVKKRKITLQHAMAESFGSSGEKLSIITNLIIALMVDGIILFLCYNFSYLAVNKTESDPNLLKTKENKPLTKDNFMNKNKIKIQTPAPMIQPIRSAKSNVMVNGSVDYKIDNNGNGNAKNLPDQESILFFDDNHSPTETRSS